MQFSTISRAIAAIRRGEMVIVCDDRSRENEGDLVCAASAVTPKKINFMAKVGRGLICVAMLKQRLEELELLPMVKKNTARLGTAFTVSCDVRSGTTTGISAFDRARSVKALINGKTKPDDLLRPGHLFPLQAFDEGVLRRAGHTEAAVDLARLAGLYPAGVLCEVMGDSGKMAKLPELLILGKHYRLPIMSIADLIRYRKQQETMVERVAEAQRHGGDTRVDQIERLLVG
jgi:3,4-dihydroxy 2-butanone 4-phosphate synthase/GTP cyclohydrolase II